MSEVNLLAFILSYYLKLNLKWKKEKINLGENVLQNLYDGSYHEEEGEENTINVPSQVEPLFCMLCLLPVVNPFKQLFYTPHYPSFLRKADVSY